ncbi:hypothetical protein [Methylobacterium sp. Leaf118]|uniref:hypothetical protein n=1 Tax=Methylobacterium sp. Leaf118 TaxID=2876562 RepID=UPI001E4A466D|nr:hypothetical protein [Methylobacterium sp. Leaf118]
MLVDHAALLKRYMAHVRACEGTDFTAKLPQNYSDDPRLTDDECEVLYRLSRELDAESTAEIQGVRGRLGLPMLGARTR